MRTVRRVGIGSAFRVGSLLSALVAAIGGAVGVIIALVYALWAHFNYASGFSGDGADSGLFLWIGLILLGYVGMIILAMIGGAIGGILYAWLYNVVATWVGGLEIQVEDLGVKVEELES